MTLFGVSLRLLVLAPLALLLSGCFPMDNNSADEEKDPHFIAGKKRVSSMDYEGAIDSFEKALISNPKNSAAHLELGFLYEEKKGNFASAIYHFERHLELRPDSKWAETINQHVQVCKQQLARTVSFALVSRQIQDDLRRLTSSNVFLVQRVAFLTNQLAEQALSFSNQLVLATKISMPVPDAESDDSAGPERRQNPVERRQSPVERRQTPVERRPAPAERRYSQPEKLSPAPRVTLPPARATTPTRSHVVRTGETLAEISKRYNVKLSALQAANPYVEARRLRAGQVLNIPGAH